MASAVLGNPSSSNRGLGRRVSFALKGARPTVLDLDQVVDHDSGEIPPDVASYITLFVSYSELSQVWCWSLHHRGGRCIGCRPGLELLTSGFLATTGHPLDGMHIVADGCEGPSGTLLAAPDGVTGAAQGGLQVAISDAKSMLIWSSKGTPRTLIA